MHKRKKQQPARRQSGRDMELLLPPCGSRRRLREALRCFHPDDVRLRPSKTEVNCTATLIKLSPTFRRAVSFHRHEFHHQALGHRLARRVGAHRVLARESIASLCTLKVAPRDLLYQMHFIGVKSQSVVLITGAFTGMVLAAQTYLQFHKVKMDTATLAVVGVSMCSELGPVLTALMVAGRVGAAMAAELGTMRVTEQIDALRTLATHPVDYLVVPRLLASTLVMPLLTVEAIALGIAAGYAWAWFVRH